MVYFNICFFYTDMMKYSLRKVDICFNIYKDNIAIPKMQKKEVNKMTLLAATNLAVAFENMIVGLGTVFLVLAFLILVISLFKYVNAWDARRQAASAAATPAPKAAPAAAPAAAAVPKGPGKMTGAKVSFADEIEGPIAAVILAAVAEECGGNFKVTSIRKSK